MQNANQNDIKNNIRNVHVYIYVHHRHMSIQRQSPSVIHTLPWSVS